MTEICVFKGMAIIIRLTPPPRTSELSHTIAHVMDLKSSYIRRGAIGQGVIIAEDGTADIKHRDSPEQSLSFLHSLF